METLQYPSVLNAAIATPSSPVRESSVGVLDHVEVDSPAEDDSIDFPPMGFYDDGDGRPCCEWDEDFCHETAQYYVLSYCEDPSCSCRHQETYCKRHYLIVLARHLHSLKTCPPEVSGLSKEERKIHVLRHHIAGFVPLEAE